MAPQANFLARIGLIFDTGGISGVERAFQTSIESIRAKAVAGGGRGGLAPVGQQLTERQVQAQAALYQRVQSGQLSRGEYEAQAAAMQRAVAEQRTLIEAQLGKTFRQGQVPLLGQTGVTGRAESLAATQTASAEQERLGAALAQETRAHDQATRRVEAAAARQAAYAEALEGRTAEERQAIALDRLRVRQQQQAQAVLNAQAEVAAKQQVYGPGSRYQRLQAFVSQREGGLPRAPTDFSTFGQSVVGAGLTTARFAVSAGVIYGLQAGVRQVVSDVESLDKALAGVQDHLNAMGRGDQFAQVRRQVLDMSAALGVSSTDVANLSVTMINTFGNVNRGLEETRSAIKLALVSGLSPADVGNNLSAVALAYDTTFEHIGDVAVSLSSKFGTSTGDIVQMLGAVAPSAQQAGLSLEQLGALVAETGKRVSQAPQAVGEAFNRILPNIQQNAAKVVTILQANPRTAGAAGAVADQLAGGRSGAALMEILRVSDQLNDSQRQQLIYDVAGQRNAKILNGLFAARSEVLDDLNSKTDTAGRLSERFATINASLPQVLARIHELLLSIGQRLAQLGALDVFKVIAGGALLFLNIINSVLGAAVRVNDILHGFPGAIAAIIVAMRAWAAATVVLERAQAGVAAARAGGGVTGAILGGGGGGAVAEAETAGGLILPAGVVAARTAATGGVLGGRVGAMVGLPALAAIGSSVGSVIPGLGGIAAAGGYGAAALGGLTTGGILAGVAFDYNRYQALGRTARRQQSQADAAFRHNARSQRIPDLALLYNASRGRTRSDLLDTATGGGSVRNFITGTRTEGESQTRAIADQTADLFRAAVDKHLLNFLTPEQQKNIENQLSKRKDVQKALKDLSRLSARDQVRVRAATAQARQDQSDIQAGGTPEVNTIQGLQSAYQAGEISYTTYIAGLKQQAANLKRLARGGDPQLAQEAADAQRAVTQAVTQAAQNAVQTAQTLAGLAGGTPTDTFNILRGALDLPGIKGNPQAENQMGVQAAQAQQQALLYSIQHAKSGAQALALASTTQALDPKVKAALTEAVNAMADGPIKEMLTGWINAGIAAGDDAKVQAIQRVTSDAVAASRAAAGGGLSPAAAAAEALKEANIQMEGAQKTGIAADISNAQSAQNDAKAQVQQVQQDIARSYRSFQESLTRNPVDRANIEMQQATADMRAAKAKGDMGAFWQASAAYQQALQAFTDAQASQAEANAQLAITTLEATGDVVGAARAKLADGQRLLREAIANRLDPGVIAQLQGQVVSLSASLADTIRNDQIGDLQFLYDTGKITAQQLIAGLREQLAKVPASQKAIRQQIERDIYGLTKQAGQDLQFNLPSSINPGSLVYESRRLAATGGFGAPTATGMSTAGYQDNRRIEIVVPDAGDPQATAQAVFDKLNGESSAPRYGTYAGVYGGGGV